MLQLTHHFLTLGPAFSSPGQIKPLKNAQLVFFNQKLATQLQLNFNDNKLIDQLVGKNPIPDALSMIYAGHQFGGFSPQLGDGRGLLLGEKLDHVGKLVDLHMKGSGTTPYSRRGDGRAVLRSSIREYLASEAMYHLGIASSRGLALFSSDEKVYRDHAETAAMLLRTAESHIRFGHFEYFFYQKKSAELDHLIDYCLNRYFSHQGTREKSIINMLETIVENTAKMIAKWQAVGFQHGVMNTDNMSILGDTIDYGPFGFMEEYQPKWISNHSDYEGRYAFERQPGVALWNLNCLCHCFSNLLSKEQLIGVLSQFESKLMTFYQQLVSAKLGLVTEQENDLHLFSSLLLLLEKEQLDYTCFWRDLSQMKNEGDRLILLAKVSNSHALDEWLNQYCHRRDQEKTSWDDIRVEMLKINPKYILRNYLAQAVIDAAQKNDYQVFNDVMSILEAPYDEHPELAHFSLPAQGEQKHICVSCSS